MKRKLIKIISVVLILCLLVSTGFAANSTDDLIQPAYNYLYSTTTSFSIAANGTAHCFGDATAAFDEYSVRLTMTLQQSSDLTNWTAVKDWEQTSTRRAILDENWSVPTGYFYRFELIVEVYNTFGTRTDYVIKYSNVEPYGVGT